MTKRNKLIQKILNSVSTIYMDEATNVLIAIGYNPQVQNSGSSHITYKKLDRAITLVLNRKELKPYQIKKLREILKEEGYTNE